MKLKPDVKKALEHWQDVHEGRIVQREDNYLSIQYIFTDIDNLDYLFIEVFKYFNQSEDIIKRAQNVAKLKRAEAASLKICSDHEKVIQTAFDSASELARFCEAEGESEFYETISKLKPEFLPYNQKEFFDLRKNNTFLTYFDVIGEAIAYDNQTFNAGFGSIEDAVYHFTNNNYFLTWYICSPLIFLDINFDDYFELRMLGYDYTLNSENIFIMPSSNVLV